MNLPLWLQGMLPFPQQPVLSLVLLFLLVTFLMWMARMPVEGFIRRAFLGLANGLRYVGKWLDLHAGSLWRRADDLACEYFITQFENKVDGHLGKLRDLVDKDLVRFPEIHRQLTEMGNRYDDAFRQAQEAKWPAPVECGRLNNRMEEAERKGDDKAGALRALARELEREHKAAVAAYRKEAHKRFKALKRLRKPVKGLRATADKLADMIGRLDSRIKGVDRQLKEYLEIRRQDEREPLLRAANHSVLTRFMIGLFVFAIVCGGGFVNFLLIQRPMAELVGGGYLGGVQVSSVAAMVVLLLELAAGIVLMELLGFTRLAPQFENVDPAIRRKAAWVAGVVLIALAASEAGLAMLREYLVAADAQTRAMLTGTSPETAGDLMHGAPLILQAVLGFVIPLVLAFAAVPLEMLFHTVRIVGQRLLCMLMWLGSGLMRVLGFLADRLHRIIIAIYDVLIFFWLTLQRWFAPLFARFAEGR